MPNTAILNKYLRALPLSVVLLFALQWEVAWAQAADVVCDRCVDKKDIAIGAITSNRIRDGTITSAASWVCSAEHTHAHALAGFLGELVKLQDARVGELMQRWGLYFRELPVEEEGAE